MSKSTIQVSDNDKEMLDRAAMELFGTDRVPYAITVRKLINEATSLTVVTED